MLTDEEYNSLHWESMTGAELKTLVGFLITGVELIDGEELELYLQDEAGKQIIINIDASKDNYLNLQEVVEVVRSPRQTKQFLELGKLPEQEDIKPMNISRAVIKE